MDSNAIFPKINPNWTLALPIAPTLAAMRATFQMATVDHRGLTIPIRIPLTNRITGVHSFCHGFWNEHRVVVRAHRSARIAAWKKEDAFLVSKKPPNCVGAQAPKTSQLFRRIMLFGERTTSANAVNSTRVLALAVRQANVLLPL